MMVISIFTENLHAALWQKCSNFRASELKKKGGFTFFTIITRSYIAFRVYR